VKALQQLLHIVLTMLLLMHTQPGTTRTIVVFMMLMHSHTSLGY
jgi:hypothetical protein